MKLKSLLKNFDYIISGFSLVVLVLLTFVGVIKRYFLNSPIPFLQEVQLFCAVWLVFFGGSVAVRTGSIVAIGFLVDLFPEKIRRICTICITVLCMCVLVFLAVNGFKQLVFMAETQRVSYVLGIPFSIIYFAFPVGCCLMAYWYGVDLYELLRNNVSDEKTGDKK